MAAGQLVGSEFTGYRVERLLGRGGMAEVYLATHIGLGRHVALKLLSPELVADATFRERFVRESRHAASIDHPNIVPIYEAGEAEGVLFIAMRFVVGSDLRERLAREGPLQVDHAVSILSQVGSALDAAHGHGLVHRDVKPGNILLSPVGADDRHEHAYLMDFGLAKNQATASNLTATGQFVGTVDYTAPEQIEGKAIDGRTDVYSLGCVLYECLTGRRPFERPDEVSTIFAHLLDPPPRPTEVLPDLPAELDGVIATALAKARHDRYQVCRDLVAATEAALPPRRSDRDRQREADRHGAGAAALPAAGTAPPPGAAAARWAGQEAPAPPAGQPAPRQPTWRLGRPRGT